MSHPRYGSREWISLLDHSLTPIARVNRLVVVRTREGMLGKVIGGTPEHPTIIALSPAERLAVIKTMRVVEVGADPAAAPGALQTTWIDWYNTSATTAQQEYFDDVTKKIDAAGLEGLPGGSQADLIEPFRYTNPTIYHELKNYRDTGGRRALFAEKTPVYDTKPIGEAKEGGPIEQRGENIVLHAGRYTYADPASSPAFKRWLDFVSKDRTVQVLRTQVAEGLASGVPIIGPIISTPYYIDYEFLVAKDVLWNPGIPGLPTWLPPGQDVQSYWGKPPDPTKVKPDWEAIPRLGEGALDFSKQLTTLAVLVGVGYLLMKLAPSPERSHAR